MKRPDLIQSEIMLPCSGPPVMATGSRKRNTLCSTSHDRAYLSRMLGDLETAATCADHEIAATEIMVWQSTIPAVIARDLDPDIHSVRFAIDLASNLGIPNLAVQHHQAHVAAVCAEHAVNEPVLGLVLDDGALGSDGSHWGCELLRVDGAKFERIGHLLPLLQPGGEIAYRESWRMAAGVMHRLRRPEEIARRYGEHPDAVELMNMLEEERNCPRTSCATLLIATVTNLLRLDAVGAQAASTLEAAAMAYFAGDYAPAVESLWRIDGEGRLDLYPVLAYLLDETDAQRGAATFHACLIAGVTEWIMTACASSGLRKVVLTGCCLQNRLIATGLRENLEHRGLSVMMPRLLAADDTAISLGQAWVALNVLNALKS